MEPVAEKDTRQAVKALGLRYVTDTRPGIQRRRANNKFRYFGTDGRLITDEAALERIRALAIPPAYENVWISPVSNGYLQATGRDAKGRKQYRYHPQWRTARDETKYGHVLAFAAVLPDLRKRVSQDLARRELDRAKVLATIVRLLETTLIRVGNEEYARQNQHFGLTTLQNQHVTVEGATVHFHFQGKSGVEHTIDLQDRRLARIVARVREMPGQELFQYVGADGQRHRIHSDDVNAYLQEVTGGHFTAKDFRTWAGTVLAAWALEELELAETETKRKGNIVRAVEQVSARLGNTPAVCRKCYVHPAIWESYGDGSLIETLRQRVGSLEETGGLSVQEHGVLRLLERRLELEREKVGQHESVRQKAPGF